MNTVDRFIASTFVRSYILLLLVGIGLYILVDLLVNLDEFTENASLTAGQMLITMLDFYGYNIPLYYSQLGGPALAFAAAFTLAMMWRNNEMTALIAAGMPLQRLMVPLLVTAVLLTAVWVVNREVAIPRLAHKIARQRDDVTGRQTAGVYCLRDANNAIVSALDLYPRQGRLRRVYIIEPNDAGLPANLIEADEAIFDPERDTWQLVRGRRIRIAASAGGQTLGEPTSYEPVTDYPLALTPEEMVLRRSAEWSELLSVQQMNNLVHSGNLPNLAAINMSRHVRLTQPVLHWIMLLLAAPFFLRREPGSVLVAGGWSLLLAGFFYGVVFVMQSWTTSSSAALIAWIPILLFGPVAVVQVANVKT